MREQEPVVSIASSQREWAAELLRFLSDYGGARLQGTVLTSQDALDQAYEVLVIDDIASYLTPRLIQRIRRSERRIIGVYDPEFGESGRDQLISKGVDATIASDSGPDELLDLVASLSVGERSTNVTDVPVKSVHIARSHRVTSVVGDDLGGDVAIALASSFARAKLSTVLVDGDTVAPMLAQRLSLPLVPNLLTALDALIQRRGELRDSFVGGPEGITMILGIPEASGWEAIRSGDVADLVEQLTATFSEVVLKVSPHIEDLSQLGGRAGRFEAARTVLGLSSDIACLASPSPVGLSRLLSWIAAARQLSNARIHVLVGGAPSSLYQRGELSEELTRSFMPTSITWLPADERRARSVWNGQSVPPGPFAKSVARFGGSMLNGARVGSS